MSSSDTTSGPSAGSTTAIEGTSAPTPQGGNVQGGNVPPKKAAGKSTGFTPVANPYAKTGAAASGGTARQSSASGAASSSGNGCARSASSSAAPRRVSSRPVRGVGVAPAQNTNRASPAVVVAKVNELHPAKAVQTSVASGLKETLPAASKAAMTKVMKGSEVTAALASAAETAFKSPSAAQKNEMLKSATEAASTCVSKAIAPSVKQLDKVGFKRTDGIGSTMGVGFRVETGWFGVELGW